MASNKDLNKAKDGKKDEFYTQLEDIEKEMRHYKEHFKGKTVFCNCDDPYESNFFKYFAINFNHLGLRKLICTCYAGSPVVYTQMKWEINGTELSLTEDKEHSVIEYEKKPYKIEITEVNDLNGDGAVDLTDINLLLKSVNGRPRLLKGDGDFRSEECVNLLKEADIVVTNPPFSLFREYVAQLISYNKKFIIIGNQNAITYKEIFPLLKNNQMWLGFGFKRNCAHFINKHYEDTATDLDHREGMIRVSGVMWFTNIDIKKRHEDMVLYKKYNPSEYPKYDNYDAIEVSKTAEIPCDYDGVMGVPITFMDKYNPEQFDIIGASESEGRGFSGTLWHEESGVAQPLVNNERTYKRIFIRKR